jgi:hypothetical protein
LQPTAIAVLGSSRTRNPDDPQTTSIPRRNCRRLLAGDRESGLWLFPNPKYRRTEDDLNPPQEL